MLVVHRKCAIPRAPEATLVLPFAERERSRVRGATTMGEAIAILLPRGMRIAAGDILEAEDGRAVAVVAAVEALHEARSDDATTLARAAFHLGNRHAAVEIGSGRLRFTTDDVLAALVRQLGLQVERIDAPFHPEPGAYARDAHGHGTGTIHEYATGAHSHGTQESTGR